MSNCCSVHKHKQQSEPCSHRQVTPSYPTPPPPAPHTASWIIGTHKPLHSIKVVVSNGLNVLKLANLAPNLCNGWKKQICVSEIPLVKVMDGCGCMWMDSAELRPWGLLSFLRRSDTQVPLLLLVKAHHSLNVHAPKCLDKLSIYQSTYLFSFLSFPSPVLLVFVEFSVHPAEKGTIQSWFKV